MWPNPYFNLQQLMQRRPNIGPVNPSPVFGGGEGGPGMFNGNPGMIPQPGAMPGPGMVSGNPAMRPQAAMPGLNPDQLAAIRARMSPMMFSR